MRVFVTGATGFIGSRVVKELIGAGHTVLGLSRTTEKAKDLVAAGAEVLLGSIDDDAIVKQGVMQTDGVIHLAFNHDFSKFLENCQNDGRIIGVLGEALAGTHKPLLITSGSGIGEALPGQRTTEDGATVSSKKNPRAASEEAGNALEAKGINVSVVRLPQVHDTTRQGLVTFVISTYRNKGSCFYVGDGAVRWPAAHVSDVAVLYRLAIEHAEKTKQGSVWNAVAEEGITLKAIAETLGKRLQLPVKSITVDEAGEYFGWLAMFASHDVPASSEKTRAALGWVPKGAGMLEDLAGLES